MNIDIPVGEQPKRRRKWKKELFSWLKIITMITIFVVFVRMFLFTNYIVYGQSMMPTIADGERVIVNKIGYEISEPERFDLIIFHATEDTDYIKRVIGLPGEHVKYENDMLYVNGEPIEEPFLKPGSNGYDSDEVFTKDFTLESKTGEMIVPDGHVFVLGDNRRNSMDSRQMGFVEQDVIVGKVNVAYWPPKKLRVFH
ncbi:signal peptidase I [Evansella cellulosilytica]|uniref:Signal peptidase I n=1 Tax=Evansella cellulosilytica (strain ATCC 21833 / DSM 2522 / FERM P-1141 / JCM 9156 / N-4) TaxID=649639 RepID=E6TTJ3_EVAC2|nr:signal peptidase I [Evansella cellulosilytica]ADU29629.1 signal peptidase I [Evansella cellulosilytica DSM 2522]